MIKKDDIVTCFGFSGTHKTGRLPKSQGLVLDVRGDMALIRFGKNKKYGSERMIAIKYLKIIDPDQVQ